MKNPDIKEHHMAGLGLNYLKMKKDKDAKKTFEKCFKEFPNGKTCQNILLGLVIAKLGQGKISDAEKTFILLKSRHPDSPATKKAEQYLQAAKKSKK